MDDNFNERRHLMHQLCTLWREMYGKEWLQVGLDEFYFPTSRTQEEALRSDLIERSVNELETMVMSVKLELGEEEYSDNERWL